MRRPRAGIALDLMPCRRYWFCGTSTTGNVKGGNPCQRSRRSSGRGRPSGGASGPPARPASSFARRCITSGLASTVRGRRRQAIAIGLSKARRAGVKLGRPPRGTKAKTRQSAAYASRAARRGHRKPSRTRSRAIVHALKREPRRAATHRALARQARQAARRRGPAARKRAARKAVATKGPAVRRAAARKAAATRKAA